MRLPLAPSDLRQRIRDAAGGYSSSATGNASSAGGHADAAGIIRSPPGPAHAPPAPARIRAGIRDLTGAARRPGDDDEVIAGADVPTARLDALSARRHASPAREFRTPPVHEQSPRGPS